MIPGKVVPNSELPAPVRRKRPARLARPLTSARAGLDAALLSVVVALEFLLQHLVFTALPVVTGVLVVLLMRGATRVSRWRTAGHQVMQANATISADNLPPMMVANLADELSRWVRRRLADEFRSGVLTRMVQRAIDGAVPPTVRLDATLHMAAGASPDAFSLSPTRAFAAGWRPALSPISMQLGHSSSGSDQPTIDGFALPISAAASVSPGEVAPQHASLEAPSTTPETEPAAMDGDAAHQPGDEPRGRATGGESGALRDIQEDAGSVAAELRSGLLTGAMALHYQPIFDDARQPCAVEALLRWQHPEWGTLMPGEFLPLARQADLLGVVTAYVTRRAIRDWQTVERVRPGLDLSLNGDLPTGLDERALDLVDALLRAQRIEPRRLMWEFPAAQASAAPDAIRAITAQLQQRGYQVGIDAWPVHLPPELAAQWGVNQIKVDCLARPSRPLLSSVLQRAHRAGLVVGASGLEDETDIATCMELGVHRMQGYGFGRPEPVDKMVDGLRPPVFAA